MKNKVTSLDIPFAGAFGARAEGAIPVRVEQETPHAGVPVIPAKRSWIGIGLRIVRNAAIAVALMALVPIAIVGFSGRNIWGNGDVGGNISARMVLMEPVRPFALPADPSITPMQAGLAFAAVQGPTKTPSLFVPRAQAARPKATWRDVTIAPGSFANGFNNLYHAPSSESILEKVATGFTPDEARFLQTLATAPIWREFDLVARAPAADLIGGRFELPFAPTAAIWEMPIPSFNATKEMAYAAVSRAAYQMSIGQRDSAETILRSIVSYGFILVDNGTTLIDELIGNVIIGIGRDGLQRFYTITHDPRGSSSALAPIKKSALTFRGGPATPRLPLDEVRAKLIARAGDRSRYHGERFEALSALTASSCTNIPELLFGPRSDVEAALAKARTDLARYPSERAMVDLIARFPRGKILGPPAGQIESLAASAGAVAGAVLRNTRMATCSRIIGLGNPVF